MQKNLSQIGQNLVWSTTEISLKQIEEEYGFPLIVRCSATTSKEYNLPFRSLALLVVKQPFLRAISHILDRNCYVVGSQLELPSNCNATFSLCNDLERDREVVTKFCSVKEVANAKLEVVYVMKDLTVTVPDKDNSGRFTTISFGCSDQLKLISSPHLNVEQRSNCSKYQNVSFKSQNLGLDVYCKRLEKTITLPLSIRGSFASHLPSLDECEDKARPVSLHDIMERGNFPLIAILQTITGHEERNNCERSLYAGMRLKFSRLEEHVVVLAVDETGMIREFTSDATFLLPEVVTSTMVRESEVLARNEYVGEVRSLIATLRLRDNSSDIAKYCKSVRTHIPITVKRVDRTPIDSTARFRSINFSDYELKNGSLFNQPTLKRFEISSPHSVNSSDRSEDSMWGEFIPISDSRMQSPHVYGDITSNVINAGVLKVTDRQTVVENGRTVENSTESTLHSPQISTSFDQTCIKDVETRTFQLQSNDGERLPPDDSSSSISTAVTVPKNLCNEEKVETVPKLPYDAASSDLVKSQQVEDLSSVSSISSTILFSEDVTRHSLFSQDENDEESPKLLTKSPPASTLQSKINQPCLTNSKDHDVKNVEVNSSGQISGDGLGMRRNQSYKTSMEEIDKVADFSAAEFSTSISGNVFPSSSVQQSSSSSARDTHVVNVLPLTSTSVHSSSAFTPLPSAHCSQCRDKQSVSSLQPSSNFSQGLNQMKQTSNTSLLLNFSKEAYIKPPPNWYPPDNVASLSVQEVTCSMRYIGMRETVVQFLRSERIDGSLLVRLSDKVLKADCGLNDLQLFKLKQFIGGWRPNISGCRV